MGPITTPRCGWGGKQLTLNWGSASAHLPNRGSVSPEEVWGQLLGMQ